MPVGFKDVRDTIGQHCPLDDPFILEREKSHGSWLVDASTGQEYLDLHTFFASAPLGANPPGVVEDPDFMRPLAAVAADKPANGYLYTAHFADFFRTFHRVLGDFGLPHLFFVEGGALAVENALKCVFDWKSRHNEARGRSQRWAAECSLSSGPSMTAADTPCR